MSNKQKKLKPCPFCGCSLYIKEVKMKISKGFLVYHSGASDCPLDNYFSELYYLREEAIKIWNTRTPDPITERMVEALTDILEIGKRDLTNEKYDGYFEEAKKAFVSYKIHTLRRS